MSARLLVVVGERGWSRDRDNAEERATTPRVAPDETWAPSSMSEWCRTRDADLDTPELDGPGLCQTTPRLAGADRGAVGAFGRRRAVGGRRRRLHQKPFSAEKLLARVRVRTAPRRAESSLGAGSSASTPDDRRCTHGQLLPTPKESDLFVFMAQSQSSAAPSHASAPWGQAAEDQWSICACSSASARSLKPIHPIRAWSPSRGSAIDSTRRAFNSHVRLQT